MSKAKSNLTEAIRLLRREHLVHNGRELLPDLDGVCDVCTFLVAHGLVDDLLGDRCTYSFGSSQCTKRGVHATHYAADGTQWSYTTYVSESRG